MSDLEHRPGVSEVNLVVRHLKIEFEKGSSIKAAIDEVNKMYGLDDVSFDEKSHVLNFAYDATHLSLDGIEKVLDKHGLKVSHDWWTRFKEGYYRFVDDNVKDNANHEPWSCHTNPRGVSTKKTPRK